MIKAGASSLHLLAPEYLTMCNPITSLFPMRAIMAMREANGTAGKFTRHPVAGFFPLERRSAKPLAMADRPYRLLVNLTKSDQIPPLAPADMSRFPGYSDAQCFDQFRVNSTKFDLFFNFSPIGTRFCIFLSSPSRPLVSRKLDLAGGASDSMQSHLPAPKCDEITSKPGRRAEIQRSVKVNQSKSKLDALPFLDSSGHGIKPN